MWSHSRMYVRSLQVRLHTNTKTPNSRYNNRGVYERKIRRTFLTMDKDESKMHQRVCVDHLGCSWNSREKVATLWINRDRFRGEHLAQWLWVPFNYFPFCLKAQKDIQGCVVEDSIGSSMYSRHSRHSQGSTPAPDNFTPGHSRIHPYTAIACILTKKPLLKEKKNRTCVYT